jgi:hypothetical protein
LVDGKLTAARFHVTQCLLERLYASALNAWWQQEARTGASQKENARKRGGRFRAWYRKRLAVLCCLALDLIADQAAHRCTADRTDRAAARKDRAADCADAGADRGILVALRHSAARTQAEHHCHCNRTDRKAFHRFHLTAFSMTTLTCKS